MVESKTQDGKVSSDVTSITQFKPFLTLQEEDYMVRLIFFLNKFNSLFFKEKI